MSAERKGSIYFRSVRPEFGLSDYVPSTEFSSVRAEEATGIQVIQYGVLDLFRSSRPKPDDKSRTSTRIQHGKVGAI
jgi:hypothetical protein